MNHDTYPGHAERSPSLEDALRIVGTYQDMLATNPDDAGSYFKEYIFPIANNENVRAAWFFIFG